MKIILASTSPRRKEILAKTGLKFSIEPSDYEEDMTLSLPPLSLAKTLAEEKAKAVAKKYQEGIIIGADTIVALGDKVLGKPKSKAEAKEMLRLLSGQTNAVITGFAIIDASTGKMVSDAISTDDSITQLSDETIDAYVESGEPLDKAGAYAIQGLGAVIVEKIDGDFFTVMGLPLFRVVQELKKFGINVL